jgi:hypothetical protein
VQTYDVIRAGILAALCAAILGSSQTAHGARYPVIAAAGDIACDPETPAYNGGSGTTSECQEGATARLLIRGHFTAVLTLGDNQYDAGSLAAYQTSYDSSWGLVKAITHPAPGNHEYGTPGASGYFRYFGAAAGRPANGYYSFQIGTWHLVSLNSNCSAIGGCGTGSPEERWLRADLTSHPARCTLAVWHHPRFSSGVHGDNAVTSALWQDLSAAHADLVLTGHDHDYERFAPLDPNGRVDGSRGIREFVVGTGGRSHSGFLLIRPGSQARNSTTFGILALTLRPTGYDWHFVPVAGGTYTDKGSGSCH